MMGAENLAGGGGGGGGGGGWSIRGILGGSLPTMATLRWSW